MTRRIKLVVAYDGTDFCGWAANAGHRTVQSTLTEAVRRVSGAECEIVGASRTDSGAHAEGQVCHFDSEVDIDAAKWAFALNRVLPIDVAVVEACEVAPTFHSRFCAQWRNYRYRIAVGGRAPQMARYRHEFGRPLRIAEMQDAGNRLVGTHDFRAYSESLPQDVANTTRTLRSVTVRQVGDEVRIDVAGTAFLRGMMRRIAGGLWDVGRGHRTPGELASLLDEPPAARHWPVVLPAKGLTLMRITYGRHPRDNREALSPETNSFDEGS